MTGEQIFMLCVVIGIPVYLVVAAVVAFLLGFFDCPNSWFWEKNMYAPGSMRAADAWLWPIHVIVALLFACAFVIGGALWLAGQITMGSMQSIVWLGHKSRGATGWLKCRCGLVLRRLWQKGKLAFARLRGESSDAS